MTTQPQRIHHLLDRLLRGVLLPEEAEQLAGAVRILQARVNDQDGAASVAVSAVRLMNQAGAQRDRAEARAAELQQQLATARDTTQRLNYRAQRAESKNATFERAVSQWDVSERGTYIPHASLRAIGIAATGTDILGSVRHLKHFQRVEQAEARVRELEADMVTLRDAHGAVTGQCRAAEAQVRELAAGQCTHSLATCEQHHTVPVAGCPYPRCRAATATGRAPTA